MPARNRRTASNSDQDFSNQRTRDQDENLNSVVNSLAATVTALGNNLNSEQADVTALTQGMLTLLRQNEGRSQRETIPKQIVGEITYEETESDVNENTSNAA